MHLGKHTIQNTVQGLTPKLDNLISSDLTILCVLSGGFMFYSDLLAYSQRKGEIKTGFVHVSSYKDNVKTDRIKINQVTEINTQKIVLVDDILDSGETLVNLIDHYSRHGIETVAVFTMLAKEYGLDWVNGKINAPIYYGYLASKEDYVYGYGMDNNEECRALDSINTLKT